jgi:hypothetical protein
MVEGILSGPVAASSQVPNSSKDLFPQKNGDNDHRATNEGQAGQRSQTIAPVGEGPVSPWVLGSASVVAGVISGVE